MKKHIANIITGSRILFSLPLLLLSPLSAWFCALYILCGLTDMIDGAAARRTGAVSKFGARLDTVADFIFVLVCLVKLLPLMRLPVWLWVWALLIALVKIVSCAVFFIRRKRMISVHSVLNKMAGFALFLFPLSWGFAEPAYSAIAVCLLASAAAIQEACLVVRGAEDL